MSGTLADGCGFAGAAVVAGVALVDGLRSSRGDASSCTAAADDEDDDMMAECDCALPFDICRIRVQKQNERISANTNEHCRSQNEREHDRNDQHRV